MAEEPTLEKNLGFSSTWTNKWGCTYRVTYHPENGQAKKHCLWKYLHQEATNKFNAIVAGNPFYANDPPPAQNTDDDSEDKQPRWLTPQQPPKQPPQQQPPQTPQPKSHDKKEKDKKDKKDKKKKRRRSSSSSSHSTRARRKQTTPASSCLNVFKR